MKNTLLLILIIFYSSCTNRQQDKTLTYYYSETSPNSKIPDFYIILKSSIENGKRTDTFYNYYYENGDYKYAFCYQKEYKISNDSILVIESRNKSYKTRFIKNLCDTTYYMGHLPYTEVNCYMGRREIIFNGKRISSHHMKTLVHDEHESSMETYYDDQMQVIMEDGFVPVGFGGYKLLRVNTIPFQFDSAQVCM